MNSVIIENDSDLVEELFEETNSLENIRAIRKKLIREKSLIDSQLQADMRGQMHILAEGMSSLHLIRQNVGETKHVLGSTYEVYLDSVKHVPGFEDIQIIARIQSNFNSTQKFVLHFESFSEQLELARQLMEQDGEFDIDNEMPNLIPAHFILSQLRQVREEATAYLRAKDATSDTRLTVRKLYEPLDRVVQTFDESIIAIAENLLETLRTGNKSLVVRTAKLLEAEERQDVVARLSQKTKANTNNYGSEIAGPRAPRQYLDRFFRTIESSIKSQFDNCMSAFPPDSAPSQLLENLSFVNSELIGAKEDLEPCCPVRWHIFNKFVLWYHQGVHRTLETIMRFEPTAEILLELLRYVKEYYATMSKAFGISRKITPELLEPPLLDGRERDLYDDYLKLLVSKLKQWYANIWEGEKRDFEKDVFHPEYHADGFGLETHTTVTKLIAQQLEVAANSSQARVIAGCVDACCEVVMSRQQSWIELMRNVTKKAIRGDQDAPQGLFEYICVIANDQDRGYAFLEQLSAKWSEPMPPRYQGRVIERFEEAQEGFQLVTKTCFLMNLEIIYSDTKPAFREIFVSDKWYSGVTIQAIIDTYADFVADAKKLLLADLFDIFLGKLCTETILWYLRAMLVPTGARDKKLNLPRGKDRIMSDAKVMYDFFTKEEYGLDKDLTRKVFYVFDVFSDVLVAPLEEISAIFSDLRSSEKDAPLDLFESMLSLRNDIDLRTLREIMTDIRAVVVQTEPHAMETDGEDVGHSFLYEFHKIE